MPAVNYTVTPGHRDTSPAGSQWPNEIAALGFGNILPSNLVLCPPGTTSGGFPK